MRTLAVLVTGSLLVTGCASRSFRIPPGELARLAQTPPDVRGERVRVVEEISATSAPAAQPVGPETHIILVPDLSVGVSSGGGASGTAPRTGGGFRDHRASSSSGSTGGKSGGAADDGKAAAIAFVVIAVTAVVLVAAIEGSRFDGWAKLHPMHPVHLFGHDGGYQVRPIAWLDPATAAATERAVVRAGEGPWHELEAAPLTRAGWTYSVYGGGASLTSALGDKALGTSFTIQGGYYPRNDLGIQLTTAFGWRDNRLNEVMYESRYTLELQAYPVAAGAFHAGLFGGAGLGYRWEDGVDGGDAGTTALTGGALFQLEVHTRIALTGRLGLAHAHGERMSEVQLGLSVY